MRLTRSFRVWTAWPGWRLACDAMEMSTLAAGRVGEENEEIAYQHRRIFCPGEVIHCRRRLRSRGRIRWAGRDGVVQPGKAVGKPASLTLAGYDCEYWIRELEESRRMTRRKTRAGSRPRSSGRGGESGRGGVDVRLTVVWRMKPCCSSRGGRARR